METVTQALQMMASGMAGIFVVMGIIALIVKLFSKF